MRTRTTVLAASVLALTLVFYAAVASAARPPSDRTPPTAPTNLRITASGPNSISLAWNASTDNSSNWWYCVRRDGQGCIRVDPPQKTITFTKLWPSTTFNYSVIAIDSAGNRSGSSNTVSHTTPADVTPPSPAPVLTATAVHPTWLTVAWTASKDNITQVGYTLLMDGIPLTSNMIGGTGAPVFDRTPGTTYTFQVVASDSFGNSVRSNVLSVTTPIVTDFVPPSAPTNLALSSESSPPEIWLDWNQSTDNVDPQSRLLYDVYLNGVIDHAAMGIGETITYCPGTGPTTIVVRAVDTSGNVSAPSNQIVFNC